MDQREFIEARNALEAALRNIHALKKPMKDANTWSWLDLLGSSGVMSYFKRNKIKEINEHVSRLQNNLNVAVQELKDIDLNVDLRISDNGHDEMLDVWFDNIFTDARVHGELKELQRNLDELEGQVNRILDVVERDIN